MPITLEVRSGEEGYEIAVNDGELCTLTVVEFELLLQALQEYRDKPDGVYIRSITEFEDEDAE